MAGLFRDEVLEAQRCQSLGMIRISCNPSFAFVTAVATLACASSSASAG